MMAKICPRTVTVLSYALSLQQAHRMNHCISDLKERLQPSFVKQFQRVYVWLQDDWESEVMSCERKTVICRWRDGSVGKGTCHQLRT